MVLAVGEVDELQSVSRPGTISRFAVGKKQDMGRLEGLELGLILRGEDASILELFSKAVQVGHVVSLAAGDVEDDDWLLVVGVGHVAHPAAENDSLLLAAQIVSEARFALAALGVIDPGDVPVICWLLKLLDDIGLPWSGLEVSVPVRFSKQFLILLQAHMASDVDCWQFLSTTLQSMLSDNLCSCDKVTALTLSAGGKLTKFCWLLIGRPRVFFHAVRPCLSSSTHALFQVSSRQGSTDGVDADGLAKFAVALKVRTLSNSADLRLVDEVFAMAVEQVLQQVNGVTGVVVPGKHKVLEVSGERHGSRRSRRDSAENRDLSLKSAT